MFSHGVLCPLCIHGSFVIVQSDEWLLIHFDDASRIIKTSDFLCLITIFIMPITPDPEPAPPVAPPPPYNTSPEVVLQQASIAQWLGPNIIEPSSCQM